ncbi:unnamed protein product [Closterium sp. NIES-64]|nr:unnamed protein product [Closterium sp. NIES-64]
MSAYTVNAPKPPHLPPATFLPHSPASLTTLCAFLYSHLCLLHSLVPPPPVPLVPPPCALQCQHCGQMLAVPQNLPRSRQEQNGAAPQAGGGFPGDEAPAERGTGERHWEEEAQQRGRQERCGLGKECRAGWRRSWGREVAGGGAVAGRAGRSRMGVEWGRGVLGGGGSSYGRGVVVNNESSVADGLVAQAEVTAGPILPGHYWYDHRAGFWGGAVAAVSRHIPARLRSSQRSCSESVRARTGVVVNGRELQRRDLDPLVRRGVASGARTCAYLLDQDGRVLDAPTVPSSPNLGPLAPS